MYGHLGYDGASDDSGTGTIADVKTETEGLGTTGPPRTTTPDTSVDSTHSNDTV